MSVKFIMGIYFATFLITLALSTAIHIYMAAGNHPSGDSSLTHFAQATIDMSEIIFGAFVGALSVCLNTYGKPKKVQEEEAAETPTE